MNYLPHCNPSAPFQVDRRTYLTPPLILLVRNQSMPSNTLSPPAKIATAGMSEVVFVSDAGLARCVVGSCIALVLFHARLQLGVLAHVVLPHADGRTGPPGKFADTAVPHMLQVLGRHGATVSALKAKMCGGAAMFGSDGPIQIGARNVAEVTRQLELASIPIVGQHVGGSKGRRVTFTPTSGEVSIDIVGQRKEVI